MPAETSRCLRADSVRRTVTTSDRRSRESRLHDQKSGFNVVTKCWQNSPRQLCGFALRKTARAAIRDSKFGICKSLAGSTLHTSRFTTSIHSMKSSTVSAASLFLGLTWILSLTSVSGQTLAPIHKLPLNEPLEKYNNPPAPPRKIETSPRMVSPHGVFISYQANVDANGNNILGDAANEPSISVDPTNGNRMVIGWRQFDSIQSDFREAGWGYTTDGGIHWTFPGVLENNLFRSDPVSHCDETGKFFYLSLRVGPSSVILLRRCLEFNKWRPILDAGRPGARGR